MGRLREADEARRAAELGPVPIRVHFPDRLVLQVLAAPLVMMQMSPQPKGASHAVMPLVSREVAHSAYCREW